MEIEQLLANQGLTRTTMKNYESDPATQRLYDQMAVKISEQRKLLNERLLFPEMLSYVQAQVDEGATDRFSLTTPITFPRKSSLRRPGSPSKNVTIQIPPRDEDSPSSKKPTLVELYQNGAGTLKSGTRRQSSGIISQWYMESRRDRDQYDNLSVVSSNEEEYDGDSPAQVQYKKSAPIR